MDNIRKALAELVELKKLKEQFDVLKQDVPDVATAAVLEGMAAEYQRRQPFAWAAARTALAEQPSVRDPLTEQQIDSAIEKHVAGFDISDEDYRSMYFFARAIEREVLRSHGIVLKGEA